MTPVLHSQAPTRDHAQRPDWIETFRTPRFVGHDLMMKAGMKSTSYVVFLCEHPFIKIAFFLLSPSVLMFWNILHFIPIQSEDLFN